MAQHNADVIIVGAGPAGLAAALYTARDRRKTIVLDKFVPGGQINLTERIENYPGIPRIAGPDLVAAMVRQVQDFGGDIRNNQEVSAVKRQDDGQILVTTDEHTFSAPIVVLTPGSDYRKLGVPGEDRFREAGAGVSYCGTCDAPFFKDKTVVAVGGGNVAVEDTLHLANYCKKVILIHRRQEFRATQVLVEELYEKVQKDKIIELKLDSVVTSINGAEKVESVTCKNTQTDQEEEIPCDGAFIFVGMEPNTAFLEGSVKRNEHGYIRCDPRFLRTNVPGVFVAGDCREGAAMQLATAIGDGVAAAMFMKEFLRDPDWWHKHRCPEDIAFA